MPTPHNSAQAGEIAKTVLMPGDPLRAEFIAKEYLSDVKCFNRVRNMLGFTGNYDGVKVSVMGSGMGMPSIGIYSYELFSEYDVEHIIRIGSAGAFSDDIKLMDLVFGMGACTDSNYVSSYNLPGHYAPVADYELLSAAVKCAEKLDIKPHVGNILSSDIFYNDDNSVNDRWKKMNVLAVDMEAAALYMNAARLRKKALAMLTISDHLYTGESLDALQRQNSFRQMMEVALAAAVEMEKHN
ncbi:MAG: purine-nucleoside phosphorylase [Eubacteriales bacterium]|nr:purine-nucleoside phosphorylase [Eubacteriales bacterium]